jgi:hypothetical protein
MLGYHPASRFAKGEQALPKAQMDMDTYLSTAVAGVFVTLRSEAAAATIPLLDELVALRLDPFRRNFAFGEEARDREFVAFVLTQIVLKGYAVHGLDPAFEQRRSPRRNRARWAPGPRPGGAVNPAFRA